jgi:Tol biopolymer transport system component
LAFSSIYGPGKSIGGVFVVNVDSREVRRLTEDAHQLPSWSRDGRWIYLAFSSFREARGIWKIPAQGGKLIAVVRDDGIFAQESLDGRSLYYLKSTGGIWKMSSEGGKETEVIPGFGAQLRCYWRVAEDGIYFLNKNSQPGPAIEFLEFTTGRIHRIAGLTGKYTIDHGGLTVSPDRRSIVYSQTSRTASEIMLVENFH